MFLCPSEVVYVSIDTAVTEMATFFYLTFPNEAAYRCFRALEVKPSVCVCGCQTAVSFRSNLDEVSCNFIFV